MQSNYNQKDLNIQIKFHNDEINKNAAKFTQVSSCHDEIFLEEVGLQNHFIKAAWGPSVQAALRFLGHSSLYSTFPCRFAGWRTSVTSFVIHTNMIDVQNYSE